MVNGLVLRHVYFVTKESGKIYYFNAIETPLLCNFPEEIIMTILFSYKFKIFHLLSNSVCLILESDASKDE